MTQPLSVYIDTTAKEGQDSDALIITLSPDWKYISLGMLYIILLYIVSFIPACRVVWKYLSVCFCLSFCGCIFFLSTIYILRRKSELHKPETIQRLLEIRKPWVFPDFLYFLYISRGKNKLIKRFHICRLTWRNKNNSVLEAARNEEERNHPTLQPVLGEESQRMKW